MTDTFFAQNWCVCVSISFILLLFHNSDGVASLAFFNPKHGTLLATLEMGKINNKLLHFPAF